MTFTDQGATPENPFASEIRALANLQDGVKTQVKALQPSREPLAIQAEGKTIIVHTNAFERENRAAVQVIYPETTSRTHTTEMITAGTINPGLQVNSDVYIQITSTIRNAIYPPHETGGEVEYDYDEEKTYFLFDASGTMVKLEPTPVDPTNMNQGTFIDSSLQMQLLGKGITLRKGTVSPNDLDDLREFLTFTSEQVTKLQDTQANTE